MPPGPGLEEKGLGGAQGGGGEVGGLEAWFPVQFMRL